MLRRRSTRPTRVSSRIVTQLEQHAVGFVELLQRALRRHWRRATIVRNL